MPARFFVIRLFSLSPLYGIIGIKAAALGRNAHPGGGRALLFKKSRSKGIITLEAFMQAGQGLPQTLAFQLIKGFVAGLAPLASYDLTPLQIGRAHV